MSRTGSASVAHLLKQHRARAGLTQEELAERAGLSARAISDLERGIAHRPQAYTVGRLTKALGLAEEEAARFRSAAREVGTASAQDLAAVAPLLPSVARSSSPSGNLPLQPTPFIGRQREMEEVSALLLREDVRLLTLTGPGGVGKTRLALRVAEEVQSTYSDGVCFVSLASLADAELVPSAMVTAFGVTGRSGQGTLEALTDDLRTKKVLLVLDNFEHLLPAVDVVSQMLVTCPHLTILVTSRVILHLAAEHQYSVAPLPAPIPGHLPDLESLSRYDVIQLFVQRGAAVNPGFELTDENAAAVAEICSRLDGLPLAIELAAARIRLLPPRSLLGRLGNRLNLLTGGPRDQPARQQTLRKTIDWSYGLLTEPEQALFACLSVFVGGCTVEAAHVVCDSARELDILDGMTALAEQSLVVVIEQPGGEPRFGMLESVRQYARERLQEGGNEESLQYRHCSYYVSLVEKAEPALWGPEQVECLDRLETEHGNLRTALRWLTDHRHVELGLRLASALRRYWEQRGTLSEGRSTIEALLVLLEAAKEPPQPSVRAKAFAAAGALALAQGDVDRSIVHYRRALDLARGASDRTLAADVLVGLGQATAQRGQLEEAAALLEEGIAMARNRRDNRRIAFALFHLGWCRHTQGRLEEARSLFEASLEVGRTMASMYDLAELLGMMGGLVYSFWNDVERRTEVLEEQRRISHAIGDRHSVAQSLKNLAWLACDRDDYERALDLFRDGLAVYRELHDARGMAGQLRYIGWLTRQRGRHTEATELLEEALRLFREAGDKGGIARTLLGLGDVARDLGDGTRARALCEESLTLFRDVRAPGASAAIGFCLNNLALAAQYEGDFPRALDYVGRALEVYRTLGESWGIAEVLLSLGSVRLAQSDGPGARAVFAESLRADQTGPPLLITIMGLEGMALVAAWDNDADRVARLFAAADAMRRKIGFPVWPVNRASHDDNVKAIRSRLGDDVFASVWREGGGMTRQEAVAYALGYGSGVHDELPPVALLRP